MDFSILENEILQLRKNLQEKEEQLLSLKEKTKRKTELKDGNVPKWAIERYSRQALLGELGSSKETINKLMNGSVLIVGVGGLGCPAAIYLTGAGVGHIGIVDYDEVELTNLHRQPLHSEVTLGMTKVESAAITLRRLNPNVRITPINKILQSSNALSIISEYDVVIDATDNAATRYLVNDACVMTGKPLVFAAALKLSGQFTVYNYPPKKLSNTNGEEDNHGPCYRCIFPVPSPPEAVGSCSQNGVLGPVPGIMGCLQAIEAMMLLLGKSTIAGQLLMFDGADSSFSKVMIRKKNPECAVCSTNPTITELIDYEQFCNSQASDKDLCYNILATEERIMPTEFSETLYSKLSPIADFDKCDDTEDEIETINVKDKSIEIYKRLKKDIKSNVVLIDVRSGGEFDMCNIEKSINCPIDKLNTEKLAKIVVEKSISEVYFVCRRGNDSQIAVRQLKNKWIKSFQGNDMPVIKDIVGGLHGWAKYVDSEFPVY